MSFSTNIKKIIAAVAALALIVLGTVGVVTITKTEEGVKVETQTEIPDTIVDYADEKIPAAIDSELVDGGQGEYTEVTEYDGEEIPTVESIDGGDTMQFEDATTGISLEDGEYADLGAIEKMDTSSVKAVVDSTLGRCYIANNIYGAQCVSFVRAFWWNYAGRDVSTCGTGLAKGMMNCWEQNAGNEFKTIWSAAEIQGGTTIVTGGSYTGHTCIALGPVVNGHVACLGENQGGKSCGAGVGGSAVNIINLSVKDFIGGYTPTSYIEPEPEPAPQTSAPANDTCNRITLKKGDTLGKIMKRCEGTVKWGAEMDEYAKSWRSVDYKKTDTVYEGWYFSANGVGLYAGDTIERIK